MTALNIPALYTEQLPAPSKGSIDRIAPPPSPPHASAYLFKNVSNASSLRSLIIAGDPSIPMCVMVNAEMVLDEFQLCIACARAWASEKMGTLKTRTLLAEVLYNFSSGTNIAKATKTFGVGDGVTSIIVLFLGNSPSDEDVAKIRAAIKGSELPLSELHTVSDLQKIRKEYKIDDAIATDRNEVLGIVLGVMALKGHQ